MTTITTLEGMMLRNICENDFANGMPDAEVWSDSLDCGPCKLKANQHGPLVASLSKKGLVHVTGDTGASYINDKKMSDGTVFATEEGIKVWEAIEK